MRKNSLVLKEGENSDGGEQTEKNLHPNEF